MKLWRSVVGKLWGTILLLVSFVLLILTLLLLEFFDQYHVNQIEIGLTDQADKIARVIEAHPQDDMGERFVFEILDDPYGLTIAYDTNTFVGSPYFSDAELIPNSLFLEDEELFNVFIKQEKITKELSLSDENNLNRYNNFIIAGVPMQIDDERNGAVFIYQSLAVLKDTTQKTTRIIFLSAGIAIMLTTFFAFFLSSRITSPLRKMKEAANQVSKGEFDVKVPYISYDEIGELAIAFNQMSKRLKINMSVLNQEKEQLTSILSSMADGVITFSRDGAILITNPPAERLLQQWQTEDKQSTSPIPYELADLLKKAIKTETEQASEFELQGFYYVVIVSPLYNQNQEGVRGAVAVIRDMTEERRLDKLRIDFVANVSHELRTPISMLQGYSEAIIDNIVESEEEKNELVKIIYDESLRISRLVNELLDLARMEAGNVTMDYQNLEMNSFMNRILHKFMGVAKEKNIQLINHSNASHAKFMMDADKIEQVLTNLIDNAIRHTGDGGIIELNQNATAEGIYISVSDNGVGIPEEDLPFVFERFYKADKARTRGKSGTGLGLAIAKNIIEAHQGHISVTSKVGEGTTFTFFLPEYKKIIES